MVADERTGDLVDLVPAGGPIASTGQRSRAVLVALAVVAALAAAVLVLVPGDDAEVAVEDDGRDAGPFPAPLVLGAPDDGKESVGLPVNAEPSTGLVDGQRVTVTGTGFPPGQAVGVVMCTKEAGRDHGARGAEACNLGRFAQADADADGVATVEFGVRRLVVLDGQEVDCASESQRCLIGMGLISDYDRSGGVLVDFDPSVPLPDPPAVVLADEGPHDDGDVVTVRVDGLDAGTGVGAAVCTDDGMFCSDSMLGGVDAGDGTTTFELRLWRAFAAPLWEPGMVGRDIDCAVVACHLQIWGESASGRTIPLVPLGFTDGPIDRPRPVIEVRSSGPHRPGDRMEVLVTSAAALAGAELLLCGPELCSGAPAEVEHTPDGMVMHLTVPSGAEGNPCLGTPCRLAAHVYVEPGRDVAPPLAPAPVEIVVEP